MTFTVTTVLALALAGLAVIFGWLGAREPDPHRGPRMIPYRFLMLLSGAGCFFMVVHLANLAGVTTGR